jgi:hypothetical protein
MEPLLIRFEQRRGHFMILERNPPVSREEINETQLQMLRLCDIPGLLPLETEESDGQLSLRYSLSGTRMLSEAMRTSNWSMFDMMGALCRLCEVLEECRLYLLDADRIRLHDEFIFVGDDWHDLRFTYIPIDMPTLHRADDLERLIIRWVLKVKEPDGLVLQKVLRLVATKGFMPISISRYARQYLAGSHEASFTLPELSLSKSLSTMPSIMETQQDVQAESKPVPAKVSRTWDIFQPPSGDLHSLSEMLGDDSGARRERSFAKASRPNNPDEMQSIAIDRWRIIVVCIGFFFAAMVWRFIYLNHPSEQKLLLCMCLTIAAGAGVLFLWNGLPVWAMRSSRERVHQNSHNRDESFDQIEFNEEVENDRWEREPRFPNHLSQSTSNPQVSAVVPHSPAIGFNSPPVMETSWIGATNDQTSYLDHQHVPKAPAYYLIWESKDSKDTHNPKIPLQGDSLVIGRSSEASGLVDQSIGISRAHAELVRISEQWKVKDLGSRNGSRLNDMPMAPYELYILQTGDCLTLANSQYRFQHGD